MLPKTCGIDWSEDQHDVAIVDGQAKVVARTSSAWPAPTTRAGCFLRELNSPCDILVTSDDWGVTKPDVAFFSKLIAVSGHQPHGIAYVGDRLDNDLGPASDAGLHTSFC